MFPLLPALLLLILQGPSSIEKMARDGRLPAALEAISRKMEAQDHGSATLSKADEAVLASFLALTSQSDVSQALFHILSIGDLALPERKHAAPEVETSKESPPLVTDEEGKPQTGFAKSQRSRDGPF